MFTKNILKSNTTRADLHRKLHEIHKNLHSLNTKDVLCMCASTGRFFIFSHNNFGEENALGLTIVYIVLLSNQNCFLFFWLCLAFTRLNAQHTTHIYPTNICTSRRRRRFVVTVATLCLCICSSFQCMSVYELNFHVVYFIYRAHSLCRRIIQYVDDLKKYKTKPFAQTTFNTVRWLWSMYLCTYVKPNCKCYMR